MQNHLSTSLSAHFVVLVEDDASVRLLLQRSLEREGLSVTAVASLAEARDALRERDWDLAMLDRGLPDGDGMKLCAELRAVKPHGYIMILTGAASDADKLQGFASGADDYVTKPLNIPELMARVRAGLRIVELQKQLLEMSLTDELTRLRNRRAFDRELEVRFEAARRYGRPLSLAAIDIDRFKVINDTFGHPTGDAVLQGVARVLAEGTRVTDFVARVGGEEFCVLLPETALFEAIHFGEKIRSLVAASPVAGLPVTVSVGLASMPHSQFSSPAELLYAADQALYRAKGSGRNRVESEKRRDRFARASCAA